MSGVVQGTGRYERPWVEDIEDGCLTVEAYIAAQIARTHGVWTTLDGTRNGCASTGFQSK